MDLRCKVLRMLMGGRWIVKPKKMSNKPKGTPDDFDAQEKQLAERAAKFRESAEGKLGVVPQVVSVFSDGTRMEATVRALY